jgi:hypothetical protein
LVTEGFLRIHNALTRYDLKAKKDKDFSNRDVNVNLTPADTVTTSSWLQKVLTAAKGRGLKTLPSVLKGIKQDKE